jgi:hypothetical protein
MAFPVSATVQFYSSPPTGDLERKEELAKMNKRCGAFESDHSQLGTS